MMKKEARDILFVSSNFPPVVGGSSVVYQQICRRLSGRLVALGSRTSLNGDVWRDLEAADSSCGFTLHRIHALQPSPINIKRSRIQIFIDRFRIDLPIMIRTTVEVVRIAKKYQVKSVCLGELVGLGWLVFPLRYFLGLRVIIYTHGEEITQDGSWLLSRWRGTFLRHANKIVSVSQFCKGQIISKFGVVPSQIHIIRNGVDLDRFAHVATSIDGFAGKRTDVTVLSVGRLVERKGQEMLLRAMRLVLARMPGVRCMIVGDGPLRPKLEGLIETLGLNGICTLHSNINEQQLVRLYQECDVFALPCHTLPDGDTEGFGLVFLEANACGIPVVAGAAGGTIEAVCDGVNGLLIDGTDPHSIADAIVRILVDEEFARCLVRGGIAWARSHNWDSAALQFADVCNDDRLGPQYAYCPKETDIARLKASKGYKLPRLLVTIDVEEEFDWHQFCPDGYQVRGQDALASFHQACLNLAIKPIYFLSWPILCDESYIEFFRDVLRLDSGELGIHLHSWVTPPLWEEPNRFTSFQCNLPEHVEGRKLATLCQRFEQVFGSSPVLHRAGRWGGSARTADLLSQNGIQMDFSPVTGFRDLSSPAPDFSNLGGEPFWCGLKGEVLTVPASAISGIRGPDWLSQFYVKYRSYLPFRDSFWKSAKVNKTVPLWPEGSSIEVMMTVAKEISRRQLPVAVVSLHNTSLYAGGNPYSVDASAAEQVFSLTLSALRRFIEDGLMIPGRAGEIYADHRLQRLE